MFNSSVPSLSDIAAVTGANNNGFGNGDGWWVLIILFAIFGGWGNGWNGGYAGRGSGGVVDGYVLASDFASIESKLDSVNNGICSLGYDQLAQMNNINQNVSNTGYAIQNAIQQDTIANMQNTNAIGAQITALSNQQQQCCCDNKALIADIKYTMATDACAIKQAINDAAQNIINNDNANYRALHDENVALQMAQKDETIADLRSRINYRDIQDSNAGQTAILLDAIRNGNGCGCKLSSCC